MVLPPQLAEVKYLTARLSYFQLCPLLHIHTALILICVLSWLESQWGWMEVRSISCLAIRS